MNFSEVQQRLKQIDPQNMWQAVAGFGDQVEEASRIDLPVTCPINTQRITNILFCGMGGSAIGGDLLATYFQNDLDVPLVVNRNYTIPGFVGENSLVVVSSYSGNTEETLSAFEAAEESGAQIIGISSNGEVENRMQASGYPLISIPGGMQPRAALGFSFIPMARLFKQLELVHTEVAADIEETIGQIRKLSEKYGSDSEENTAFHTARDIIGTVPVVYTVPELEVVGVRWKGQLAENAHILAFHNRLPEMNHNEIMGWDQQPDFLSNISLIWLRDDSSHPGVLKRLTVTSDLIGAYPKNVMRFSTEGASWMTRLFSLIHLGDWISLYAALLQEVDPTPVERISLLKSRLAE